MRADGSNDGMIVVDVPGERVPTLYTITGEIIPLVALGFCMLVVVLMLRAWRLRARTEDRT